MRSLTRLALVAAAMALGGQHRGPASAARTQGENDAGIQAAADQATAELQSWAGRNPTLVDSTIGVDILVYVHVFYAKDTGEGKLTNQQALDQVKWLNYSFGGGQGGAKTRFDFVYRSYENIPVETRLVDVSGNTHGDGSDYGPRTRTLMGGNHVGGVSVLNLYVADLPGGTFGVSTFPQYAAGNPRLDGIWIDRGTWRGTPKEGTHFTYQGDTAVHEAGHWIGALAHTDTSGRCLPNFMSYASDSCMTSFNRPQATRMSNAWSRYR